MNKQGMTHYRWTICALLFFATTINYLDRQVISLLKGTLEKEFSWTETDYSNIVIAFQFSYAIGMLGVGRLIDSLGSKKGYVLSIFLWSIASIAHALATSTVGFGMARAALGITEAGNFPSAVKAVAEWFPKKERSLANGVFNSGTNIGAIIAPLTVPFIAVSLGWQWAFIITGSIGFLWLIAWWYWYDIPSKHTKVSKTEFDYIHSDAEERKEELSASGAVSWKVLLQHRQTWAIALGKFFADPVWWFYLFWTPAFLKSEYGLSATQAAWPVALVYTFATIGSVAGGWLPMYFSQKGWTIARSRKTAMLIYAVCALPVVLTQTLGAINMWLAVLMIGFACAAHQAWSGNMYTLISDMFPKRTAASVTGIGTMAGALSAILVSKIAGWLFDYYKHLGHINTGYFILFLFCSVTYIVAWLIIHWLAPGMKRVEL